MKWIKVEDYYLKYDERGNRCHVKVRFREGGTSDGKILEKDFSVDAATALYLADMLRNESPVFYDPDARVLSTTKEVVGEGEA